MFLDLVAQEITRRTELIVDIEPSHANIDDSHFILGYTGGPEVECTEVLSSYEEDKLVIGDTNKDNPAIYANQLASRSFNIRFPIFLRFRVNSSGSIFRKDITYRAAQYCMLLNDAFKIPVFQSLTDSLVERIQAIVPDFKIENPATGLSITVGFVREPGNDIAFERDEEGERQDAYIYEVYWEGEIILNSGIFTSKYNEFNYFQTTE